MTKIISVLSSRSSNGRTTITANLAATLAQAGKRVCILDASFTSSIFVEMFGGDSGDINLSINSYLWGRCLIEDTLLHLKTNITKKLSGEIFIVPSSSKPSEIARMRREGYDDGLLNDGIRDLCELCQFDYLILTTRTPLEESLLMMAISDIAIHVSQFSQVSDRTAAIVFLDIAAKLDVPYNILIFNKISKKTNLTECREVIKKTYGVEPGALIPISEDILECESDKEIFALKYPDHPITEKFRNCANLILEHIPSATIQIQPNQHLSKVVSKIEIPSIPPTSPELNKLFNELNSLIGLKRVKADVYQLIQFVKIQNLRKQRGLGQTELSLHSVFYGSPGTGKTTVARIYGKMLNAMGLLSRGHLVETDRPGLVANYVGQTATKTDAKITESLGGVLFIDEAYSLYKGEHSQNDFGIEAIEVLLKRMEDNRGDFAVIVAGYPQPMENFLDSNEGLKSRFVNNIHFEDFLPDELVEIFVSFATNGGYRLKDDALNQIGLIVQNAYTNRSKSFGNARFCRTLFEKVIRNQSLRIAETISSPTEDDLQTINLQDVSPLTNSKT
jgi:MinD-like ATPase involved in chromosome partitioning or flagellar assembly